MNLSLLAQATSSSTCTLNNQPIDCSELAHKAQPFIGLGLGLLAAFSIILIASLVFWLLMLIHALQHKSPDRDIWIIVLIVSFVTGFSLVGAIVYFFAEKKKAEEATAKAPPAKTPPASSAKSK